MTLIVISIAIYAESRYNLDVMKFEWDEDKNKKNRKKHGIWFEEAQQIFDDSNAIEFFDSNHSSEEDRFIMLGMSASS